MPVVAIKDYEKYFRGVDPQYVKKLLGIIMAVVPNAKIILYGSRARGDFRDSSDIDIALDMNGQRIPSTLFMEAHEFATTLHMTHSVDLVDLADARGTFREEVTRDGIVLNDLLTSE